MHYIFSILNLPLDDVYYSLFQIRKENKAEVEQNIRDALESICKPDDVEKELRAAMTTLNLDSREDQS